MDPAADLHDDSQYNEIICKLKANKYKYKTQLELKASWVSFL